MFLKLLLLGTAALASLHNEVLNAEVDLPSRSLNNASLVERQAFPGYSAAVIEITFYAFIDSTVKDGGDCASLCSDSPNGPFTTLQGTVAHTCTNPDGSQRTNSAGFPTPGGDGTFNSPISAAATDAVDTPVVAVCDVFWSPYLYKWFIYDDSCPSCTDTPSHFDLFIGGSAADTECPGICSCENALTPTNGANFGTQDGDGAACIFYDFSATDSSALFPYQPVETGPLFSGGKCISPSNLNGNLSSSGDGGLCEVCLVSQSTCTVGDSADVPGFPSLNRKRAGKRGRDVTARAALPQKTASPKL